MGKIQKNNHARKNAKKKNRAKGKAKKKIHAEGKFLLSTKNTCHFTLDEINFFDEIFQGEC